MWSFFKTLAGPGAQRGSDIKHNLGLGWAIWWNLTQFLEINSNVWILYLLYFCQSFFILITIGLRVVNIRPNLNSSSDFIGVKNIHLLNMVEQLSGFISTERDGDLIKFRGTFCESNHLCLLNKPNLIKIFYKLPLLFAASIWYWDTQTGCTT